MALRDDLRLTLRSLRRTPSFAAVAVVTLALAIGPNAAIFSAVDALLLRLLPFPDADRLVRIESVRGGEPGSVSYREVQDLRALDRLFVDAAQYTDQGQYNASGDGRPEELVSTITTQNLFRVLGVAPRLGAPWPELLDRTRDFKLVISHELWQRRFGGDPQILGRTMTLDGAPGYTIVGVMPPGFAFPVRSDLYRSHGIASAAATYEDRGNRNGWAVARLRRGVTVDQARRTLAGLAARLEAESPATNTGVTYRVTPLRDLYVGDVRPYLLLVLAAVSLVLLVASGNVANLLLARVFAREREIGMRVALGASRWSAVRLLLVESVVLAALAGALGLLLAVVGVRALTALVRLDMPRWLSIELSGGALAFTAAVSLLAGLLAGVLPAWRVVRTDPTGALRSGARGASGGVRQRRLRSALVTGELALAVMLLVGAGLLLRSFQALVHTSPGFDPDALLTFRVELGWRAYPGKATARFHRDLLARLAELPGVTAAAMTNNLPLGGRPRSDAVVALEGQGTEALRANPYVNVRVTSPSLFAALRIPLVRGRLLTAADRDSALPVAVVARATAARLWPGRDPIGARLLVGSTDSTQRPWRTVVGVVDDVRHDALSAPPALDVYLPFEQGAAGGAYYLLRTRGDPLALARRAPELVWALDPNQSFFDVRTMRDRVADRVWVPRLAGVLFSAFGVLAAALAALGVFAVLAYAVAQRTRELGIRQALGAAPGDLSRLVLREGLRLAVAGGAIGLVGAVILALLLRHLLYGVSALDGPTLVTVPVLLLLVAAAACWVPGRRATRVAPAEALRADA
jgi:putative ABC transport system permease protein